MRIGKLRHKVQLQNSVSSRNSVGEVKKQWETYDSVWAQIKPGSGGQSLSAQQEQAEINVDIIMRFHSSINPKHRIVYADRIYEILSVIDYDTRKSFIIIKAKQMM